MSYTTIRNLYIAFVTMLTILTLFSLVDGPTPQRLPHDSYTEKLWDQHAPTSLRSEKS